MYKDLLRKARKLSRRVSKPKHAVSQFRMLVNDYAKQKVKSMQSPQIQLKFKENVELLTNVTQVLSSLQNKEALPVTLQASFRDLFK